MEYNKYAITDSSKDGYFPLKIERKKSYLLDVVLAISV